MIRYLIWELIGLVYLVGWIRTWIRDYRWRSRTGNLPDERFGYFLSSGFKTFWLWWILGPIWRATRPLPGSKPNQK